MKFFVTIYNSNLYQSAHKTSFSSMISCDPFLITYHKLTRLSIITVVVGLYQLNEENIGRFYNLIVSLNC